MIEESKERIKLEKKDFMFRNQVDIKQVKSLNEMQKIVFHNTVKAGWWELPTKQEEIEDLIIFSKLGLIHSEISEAFEGYRKDKMDNHLPNRKEVEVELADAIIRILDLAEALNLKVGSALLEKMLYNKTRADHKLENRQKEGGKKI